MSSSLATSGCGNEDRLHRAVGLIGMFVLLLVVPLGIRVLNAQHGSRPRETYLPALEGPRDRAAFAAERISELARLQPGFVVIGDSMAGTRIDAPRLGARAGRPVAPLLQPGSGPAFWYLALKNWVIASGIRPRAVFVFFRDTNMTDVLFRLDEQFRASLDSAALEHEEELNTVIASRITPQQRLAVAVEDVYQGPQARKWIEPALTGWPARLLIPSRRHRTEFIAAMNRRFDLDHQRRSDVADVQTSDDQATDFARDVNRSVLPLMLRDARAAGLTLCLVRVQRRPVGGRPPAQSSAMRRYIRDLQAYVQANGGVFHDDTGDPALTLDMYEDGDHLARTAQTAYTDIFFDRLRPLFQ
ncbi:MAG: hypothetical protein JF632_02835 [Acidobacteria bacterium]|nr:hypothetical protein [Acidobacteriota bacterium]